MLASCHDKVVDNRPRLVTIVQAEFVRPREKRTRAEQAGFTSRIADIMWRG